MTGAFRADYKSERFYRFADAARRFFAVILFARPRVFGAGFAVTERLGAGGGSAAGGLADGLGAVFSWITWRN